MALDKVVYVDGETVIYADNLNNIQDEIISNAGKIAENTGDIEDNADDISALQTTTTEQGETISALQSGKVDKVSGKGLSTNDFTNEDKSALDNIKTTDTTLAVSGKAADANTVGDAIAASAAQIETNKEDIAALEDAFDSVITNGGIQIVKITKDSESVTEYKENGNRGYINGSGNFVENAGYATFLYNVDADGYVWFDSNTGNKSIAVFRTNQIGSANFVARYRTNDGNLPDADNKLAVTAGQMLAIGVSVSSTTQAYNDFVLNVPETDETIYLTNNVNFNSKQEGDITDIAAQVKKTVGTISRSGTDYVITNRNARYTVRRFDNAETRAYLWRIYKCEISASGGNWVTLWESSDADGVVKIDGEDDFIGGYHGDETETSFAVYVDGVLKNDAALDMPYQTVEMYQQSDLYHCNTSQTPDVVAFKRNKILRFDEDGCHVCNDWTAQESLDLQYVYAGMLSVNRYISGTSGDYLITKYHTDKDFRFIDADTGESASHDVTDVVIGTVYGDTEIEMRYITNDQNYSASVSDYDTETSQRLKVYAGLRNAQVSSGDIVRAEAVIKI